MAKKDTNQIAFSVVQISTGEASKPVESVRAKAGKLGGLKGGVERAKKLTAEKRSEIAKKAAGKRWGTH